jgi:hypothetical protein
MNELMREIEEDLRRERYERLWARFGKIMIGASILLVFVTIGVVAFKDYKKGNEMAATAQIMKAIDRMKIEDYKGAIGAVATLLENPSSSYYPFALLYTAQSQERLKDTKSAEKTYELLAKTDSEIGALTMLARSGQGVEIPAPQKNAPLYYTVLEWRGWQLLEKGKKEEAGKIFAELGNDETAPATLRARAKQAALQLGAK